MAPKLQHTCMPHVTNREKGGTSTERGGASGRTKRAASSLCVAVRVSSTTIPHVTQVIGVITLTLCLSAPALAQDEGGSPAETAATTRASQIQAERLQKAAHLDPEQLTPGEKHLTTFKETAEQLFQKGNVHLQVGGLPSGSSFAMGPVFQWSNSTDSVRVGFSAVGSVSQFYRADAGLTFPKLLRSNLVADMPKSFASTQLLIKVNRRVEMIVTGDVIGIPISPSSSLKPDGKKLERRPGYLRGSMYAGRLYQTRRRSCFGQYFCC